MEYETIWLQPQIPIVEESSRAATQLQCTVTKNFQFFVCFAETKDLVPNERSGLVQSRNAKLSSIFPIYARREQFKNRKNDDFLAQLFSKSNISRINHCVKILSSGFPAPTLELYEKYHINGQNFCILELRLPPCTFCSVVEREDSRTILRNNFFLKIFYRLFTKFGKTFLKNITHKKFYLNIPYPRPSTPHQSSHKC